jgi:two-component system OmpR family response regulator
MSRAGHVVLVVDDEPNIREVLRRALVAAGYQTREAASSVEACRIFGQHRIDAVILDLRMPVLSGFDLLEWLRTEPLEETQTVPVFILTGHAVTDAEQDTLRRRHAELFFKPHGMGDILQALGRVTHARA